MRMLRGASGGSRVMGVMDPPVVHVPGWWDRGAIRKAGWSSASDDCGSASGVQRSREVLRGASRSFAGTQGGAQGRLRPSREGIQRGG